MNMSSLKEIKTKEEWQAYASSIPPTTLQIIYFKTEWAAPCKLMTTVLETLASSYPVTDPLSTSWISVDAEEAIEVSDIFKIAAVPFVILRRDTQIIESISGSDASKVRAAIEKNTNSVQAQPNITEKSSIANVEIKSPSSNSISQDTSVVNDTAGIETKETKEELHKRLAKTVRLHHVMLFMKGTPAAPQCGFSRQIVSLLRERGIKYGFFNILADETVRQGLKEFADWPTYPQLWVNGELVGGLDIVKEEFSNNPDFLKS
ncbi:Monothiol glutaredoxin-3 [Erysiphe necator]|uniref:Putative monothiol glutaredoxin-5 n=1 Tax=Uncinula necator TaxID=52586 RepID=A0A0B1P4W6_UNCNE|nr:Monothiol glutaredoxin-3 [Erysiphe necator]KHJ33732.1 putative monothiol glutaredoxin-5 [Erysiphe necator]